MSSLHGTDGIQANGLDTPEFLDKLRAGDADAFETLVRATSPRLLAVARRMLGNEEDACDVLQDGLLAAYRARAEFRGGAKLATWLHRIVVNAALMKLRSRRRRPEASLEDLLPHFDATGCHMAANLTALPDAERVLVGRERLEEIRWAVAQLPESHRQVFVLRDVEDLDTAEVAALLGVSDGVVKTRLHRARQALRTLLAQPPSAAEPAPAARPRARTRRRAIPWVPAAEADFGMLRA